MLFPKIISALGCICEVLRKKKIIDKKFKIHKISDKSTTDLPITGLGNLRSPMRKPSQHSRIINLKLFRIININ
ncbi:hypothetical protein BpHYR1_029035 [Brachionus plicatilis]|uniref:Uncharacterized protein n=1 Tax=Brachionus plicatilis TaxID=10195 RepID=A0A3M7S022_BRAPC|nr:hypothetical protein BpHYR1_029035 [Brachionus plicatilis]